jgi:hypothetical protein
MVRQCEQWGCTGGDGNAAALADVSVCRAIAKTFRSMAANW